MEFVIDTSAFSAAQRGDKKVLKILNKATLIHLPQIVEGELRAGYAYGSKRNFFDSQLDKFIGSGTVNVLRFSSKTAVVFGDIYAELRKAGKVLSQNDLWISALCRENNLPLLTLDKDFDFVIDLRIIKV